MYLISNVKIKFSGLISCDLDLSSQPFLLEPTQKLDCGISLLLDPDSKPKLWKNNFEKKGKFFKYASWLLFLNLKKFSISKLSIGFY